MIEVEHIDKWYGRFQVLKDCSLKVERGEVMVICGPSGSGKSTLIKCINGLESVDRGRIVVDGTEVTGRRTKLPQIRARIGMVFQHFELFPHKTALENLTLAQVKVLGRSPNEAKDKAMQLLGRVGLLEHAHKYPHALSGGQQQRVAIARALAMDPVAMLFDEPTSALDPEMISEVLEVMIKLATDGMTMIVVTHEMGFARSVAQRIIFMDEGETLEAAPTKTFFEQPSSDRARAFLSKILSH